MTEDYYLMDYENATKEFCVEYTFINEDGNEDVGDIVFCALDADDAERKFEQRFANEIVSIQAV
jgi:hypothetical protein